MGLSALGTSRAEQLDRGGQLQLRGAFTCNKIKWAIEAAHLPCTCVFVTIASSNDGRASLEVIKKTAVRTAAASIVATVQRARFVLRGIVETKLGRSRTRVSWCSRADGIGLTQPLVFPCGQPP